MVKTVQIRGVPDEVHNTLFEEAQTQGLSLSGYLRRELESLARRAQALHHNDAVIREARAGIATPPDRETVLAVLHEGRGE